MDKKKQNAFDLKIFSLPLFSFSYCSSWYENSRRLHPVLPKKAITEKHSANKEPLFVINSLMLYRCFTLLTETAEENLHVVTGSVIGRVRSLEQIIPLSLSVQSVSGVTADNQSLAEELLRLYQYGLRPLGYFHSHPGLGNSATYPSGIDRQTQATMEQSGSEIIGAIFSRDGFIRFYANNHEPNVKVIGKCVKRIERNVYKLEIEEDI